MTVSTPKKAVYFYQLTSSHPRLLFFCPLVELKRQVRQRVVRRTILVDYPYGLEVDVDRDEYSLLRILYGFVIPCNPFIAHWAFKGILEHESRVSKTRTGLIDAAFLHVYASRIEEAIDRIALGIEETTSAIQLPHPEGTMTQDDAYRKIIRTTPPPRTVFQHLQTEGLIGKVQMSKGASAEELFATLAVAEEGNNGRRRR